jgi:hypothetical protein
MVMFAPVTVPECGSPNCGICLGGGRDYRAMHWVPQPRLTSYNLREQRRGRSWWFTDKKTMEEATSWDAP